MNRWEYLEVECDAETVRRVNFLEPSDSKTKPLVAEYVDQLGADGWELVSASAISSRFSTLWFKRQRP